MAIVRRIRKKQVLYQARIRGSDGKWITGALCETKKAAKVIEAELIKKKSKGVLTTQWTSRITIHEYFLTWEKATRNPGPTAGWRKSQLQMYRDYIHSKLGRKKLSDVRPFHIQEVLSFVASLKRSPQTQLHVYSLLHKLFGDAIELFQIIDVSPVKRSLKPKLPQKESRYLSVEEATRLLVYSKDKPFGLGIWLGLLGGMRIGEIQYLKFEHLDLENGIINIQGTYARKERQFRNYPKGKRWHKVKMPPELKTFCMEEKLKSTSEFVVPSFSGKHLSYHAFSDRLKKYCSELGIKPISTHVLRHSASELYMQHGASRDDLRILFNHSSGSVTDRYVHDKGERLGKIAGELILIK